MTAVFYDIYLFSISTLFKILEWATSSYVGSVLKKICQKFATVNKGTGCGLGLLMPPDHLESSRYFCQNQLNFDVRNYVPIGA